jgi:DNA-binding YbaB/EbfC family protein
MGLNFGNLMKQVQNVQKKAAEAQEELANLEVIGESGGVRVICDGQGKFKSITISAEVINPENPESVDKDMLETLEDVISTAMKQAGDRAAKEMEERMKKVTGGVKIPGLF